MFTLFLWLGLSNMNFPDDITTSNFKSYSKSELTFGRIFLIVGMAPMTIALDIALWPLTIIVLIRLAIDSQKSEEKPLTIDKMKLEDKSKKYYDFRIVGLFVRVKERIGSEVVHNLKVLTIYNVFVDDVIIKSDMKYFENDNYSVQMEKATSKIIMGYVKFRVYKSSLEGVRYEDGTRPSFYVYKYYGFLTERENFVFQWSPTGKPENKRELIDYKNLSQYSLYQEDLGNKIGQHKKIELTFKDE